MVLRSVVAFGFNAHSQLPFDAEFLDAYSKKLGRSPLKEDVKTPTTVMTSSSQVVFVYVGWSDTLFIKDSELYWFGAGCSSRGSIIWKLDDISDKDLRVFADHTGPRGLLSSGGKIHWFHQRSNGQPGLSEEAESSGSVESWENHKCIQHVAVAGNGRVAIVKDANHILCYTDLDHFKDRFSKPAECEWKVIATSIIQLVANETSFAALVTEGDIWTWGDPRFSLGREISDEEPAAKPCPVSALEGLAVGKIAAGGCLMAAVSEAEDLYIWGRAVAGSDVNIEFIPEAADDVGLVDLGDEVHVVDVVVGAGHIAALTSDGDVYTAGRNENGQTGFETGDQFQRKWQKPAKSWDGSTRKVCSGPSSWNTLFIAEDGE